MPDTTIPPTRLISWQQVVLEADPDYWALKNRPWIYEMSNARRFYATVPTYLPNDGYLVDEIGVPITDQYGGLIPV